MSGDTVLETFFAPRSLDDFVACFWLREHLLCPGSPERFSGLLSWTEFNAVLGQHCREPHRFRLAHQGLDLPADKYVKRNGFGGHVQADAITRHLRHGATLVFHAADEVHPPLRRLAETFERFFRGDTQINLYSAFGGSHGLDVHADDEEIFILQLEGRKRWLLYETVGDPEEPGALGDNVAQPDAHFDRVLEPGDVLYIPRGCRHVAVPMHVPTLHATIGVKNVSDSPVVSARRPTFNLPWSVPMSELSAQHAPAPGLVETWRQRVSLIREYVLPRRATCARSTEYARSWRSPRSTDGA